MSVQRAWAAAACGLLVLGLATDRAAAGPYRPKVGKPHPPIVLPTIEHDRTVALSDFRGKKVLLVHFASW